MTVHLRDKPQQHESGHIYQQHRGYKVEGLRNQRLCQQHLDASTHQEFQHSCLSWLQKFVKLREKR
jgi:ATP-dependent exoDNAse (exonuclease V) beta subunit